jgi:hypothetical protein
VDMRRQAPAGEVVETAGEKDESRTSDQTAKSTNQTLEPRCCE